MANEHVHEFGDTNFETEVLQSDLPVLVDFWATWCAPCRMIAPHIDALAEEYLGRAKVGKVDVDQARAVAQRFNIMSIPAVVLFKNGEQVDQVIGAVPKDKLQSMIDKAL